jgi:hypothetical protein
MDIARRVFAGVALTGSVAWMAILRHTGSTNESRLPPVVRIAEFDAAGRLLGIAGVASVRKTDAEWKKLLAVTSTR